MHMENDDRIGDWEDTEYGIRNIKYNICTPVESEESINMKMKDMQNLK